MLSNVTVLNQKCSLLVGPLSFIVEAEKKRKSSWEPRERAREGAGCWTHAAAYIHALRGSTTPWNIKKGCGKGLLPPYPWSAKADAFYEARTLICSREREIKRLQLNIRNNCYISNNSVDLAPHPHKNIPNSQLQFLPPLVLRPLPFGAFSSKLFQLIPA